MKHSAWKKRAATICGLGLVTLLCAACATTKAAATADESAEAPADAARINPVYVTNRKKILPLPTTAIEKPLDIMQHMSASFKGNSFSADCLVLADERQLFMAILNEFGTTVGSLVYGDEGVDFESAVFPKQLKAEYIVLDVQLCFYRVDMLQRALEKAGLRLEVRIADNVGASSTETRTVYDGKKKLIVIEKAAGVIRYENLLRGYSYTLEGAPGRTLSKADFLLGWAAFRCQPKFCIGG